jgi:hypothetical protein
LVSFEQIVDVVLDEAVRAAFDEAARVGLPICEGCLSRWLSRRMVLDVLPALRADYDRRRHLTEGQARTLIQKAGRRAAHAHCP